MKIIRWGIMIAFAAGLLVAAGGATGQDDATSSPTFLYTVCRHCDNTANPGLYRAEADGSNARRISELNIASHNFIGWAPDGDWFYFTHWLEGAISEQIFRMRPDGTGMQPLTEVEGMVSSAMLSPDGQWLYYWLERRTATWSISRVRTDGTGEETLVEGSVSMGVLSHDGDWLYYSDRVNRHDQLFRMRVDGTDRQALTGELEEAWFYRLAAGEWRYFFTFDGAESVLYRVRAGRESIQEVTRLPHYEAFHYLNLSPGAEWLTYVLDLSPARVAIVRVDGPVPVLVRQLDFDVPGYSIDLPCWTPDGKWLLLTVDEGRERAVFRVAAAHGTLTNITPDIKRARLETVSSDSRWAIVSHYRRGEFEVDFHRVAIEGGPDDRHLGQVLATFETNAWQIIKDWSPDGKWFYLDLGQLYRLHIETAELEKVTDGPPILGFMTWVPE
jgi:Tol biopolymer transport system component